MVLPRFRSTKSADNPEEAQTTFISEVYRALPVNCNFTADQEKLMSHPYIPRCLSLEAALGYKGRLKRRTLASSVPWAILQLRHSSVLFAYFFQYNKGVQPETHDPGKPEHPRNSSNQLLTTKDVLRLVLGNTKWTLDFSHWLLNEVFDMADEFESVFNDQEAFTQKCTPQSTSNKTPKQKSNQASQ
jgi:mediator of RNA polymerase II transcription subunit 16